MVEALKKKQVCLRLFIEYINVCIGVNGKTVLVYESSVCLFLYMDSAVGKCYNRSSTYDIKFLCFVLHVWKGFLVNDL